MRFLEAQAQDVGFGSDGEDVSEVLFVGSCVSQVPRPDEHVQRRLHVSTCFAAAQPRAFHATRRRHFVSTTVVRTWVHSSSSPFHPSQRFGFGKEVRAGSNPKVERETSLSNQDRTHTRSIQDEMLREDVDLGVSSLSWEGWAHQPTKKVGRNLCAWRRGRSEDVGGFACTRPWVEWSSPKMPSIRSAVGSMRANILQSSQIIRGRRIFDCIEEGIRCPLIRGRLTSTNAPRKAYTWSVTLHNTNRVEGWRVAQCLTFMKDQRRRNVRARTFPRRFKP